MGRECDRFNQARKNRSGIQLTCDIYVPVPLGGSQQSHRIDFYKEEKELRVRQVRKILEEMQRKVKELDGIVQVSHNV